MGRELISRRTSAFVGESCDPRTLCGISHPLEWLSPTLRQIVHALLTRSPLILRCARLACMRHAISVRSEPGSNSPYDLWLADLLSLFETLYFPETTPTWAPPDWQVPRVRKQQYSRDRRTTSAASLFCPRTCVREHHDRINPAVKPMTAK